MADSKTRKFGVKIKIKNEEHDIKKGMYAISDVEHKKYEYTEYHATLIAKQNFYNIALRITSDKMFLTIPGKFYVLKLNKVWP